MLQKIFKFCIKVKHFTSKAISKLPFPNAIVFQSLKQKQLWEWAGLK